jgi:plastocyanin
MHKRRKDKLRRAKRKQLRHRREGKMENKLRMVALVVVILAMWVAACGPGPSVPPTPKPGTQPTSTSTQAEITITNFAFNPQSLTVKAGTTVKWTNQDSAPHTITSDAGDWDSGSLGKGQSFSHTFAQAGTFTYHCTIHPSMKGTIVVTE